MSKNQMKICSMCEEEKKLSDFYSSYSPLHKDNKLQTCKKCLQNLIKDQPSAIDTLRMIDKPFIHYLWVSANNKPSFVGEYFKLINAKDFRYLTFKDSDFNQQSRDEIKLPETITTQQSNVEVLDRPNEDQNEKDVIRMLGYDPFEMEHPNDRRHLFNKLVDFLDDSTLEDSFKLPAVIEIVKTFNQIDKLNSALSIISTDVETISQNIGGIKHLIDAKEKMLKSVLALAKDNGISVNHNNNKSKGAGTLSGIIKQLHEKGINDAEINVYDIETSEGMKQVADISNKSIFEQLMLNENDYTEMIKDQREMVVFLQKRVDDLEEENRKLKVKLKFAEIDESKRVQVIDVDDGGEITE